VRRILLSAFVVLAVCLVPVPAEAQEDAIAQRFLNLVNQERRARGIREVQFDSPVTGTSCDWNKVILGRRSLDHDPDLRVHVAVVVPYLAAWAENLGTGPNADGIHDAWMHSSAHSPHILDPNLELVGICVARDTDNQLWVTQRFATSRPPPPTAPTTAPTTTTPRPVRTTTTAAPTTTAPPATAAPVTEPPTTTSTTAALGTTTLAPVAPPQLTLDARPAASARDGMSQTLVAVVVLLALTLASVGALVLTRSRHRG
jgi:hypothetical protein